jgi:hypothetical protein
MKQKYTTQIFITVLILSILGCTPTIEPPIPSSGELDFSNYIAVGGSITAGLSNREVMAGGEHPEGGLYAAGQMNSFPAIFARQINHIEPIHFSQPMAEGNGSSYIKLDGFRTTCDNFAPTPRMSMARASNGWYEPVRNLGPFNNMGIPELRMADIHDRSRNNPYLNRVIADTATYYETIRDAEATFFTLWLGLEDFLQYAYLGGKGYSITEVETYKSYLKDLLLALLEKEGARGLVANIPDISHLPFFRSIKPLVHTEDCAPRQMWVETCSTQVFAARENDLILLTCFDQALGQIGSGWGASETNPVPNKYVLDEVEVQYVQTLTQAYNEAIKEIVDEINENGQKVALVDTYTLFEQIYKGKVVNGIEIDATFIYGSFFSLDGIFPTARGNALITNHFIRTLNAAFQGTSVPPTNVTNYPGVAFP